MSETGRLRVGIDLAKGVFQVHAVREAPGEPVVMRRRLKRSQVEAFLVRLPPATLIGMEACGSAHFWARLARRHGHEVRLMPPAYVKPFVKRNKTDANDAAAICEAVARPTMRFVPVKSEADQAMLTLHRIRASFVGKRTALANQLRATLAEFGIVAPAGNGGLSHLLGQVVSEDAAVAGLPKALRLVLGELARQWESTDLVVRRLDAEIAAGLRADRRARRLVEVPTIGPIGASAIAAHLPEPRVFASARDFAAWIGLTPRETSSGQTLRRGGITKQGDGYLRRLLVLGATARLARIRRGLVTATPFEKRMAAHPKRKLAAVALANKTARIAWAMLARNEAYRPPGTPATAL